MIRDLLLGARFAVTGGRPGRTRTLLTALGVGAGVVLLLVAASVPSVLEGRDLRHQGRDLTSSESGAPRSDRSFLYAATSTLFHDRPVRGTLLRPDGAHAPAPPGVAAVPEPGGMVVSPALGRLLASPEGALLTERLPYEVTGRIGDAGLVGPAELVYYAHSPELTDAVADGRADRFGHNVGADRPSSAFLLLLIVVACVVLLLPVLVLVATAARFGGERRDRRLAALRLVGADIAMTRRIAAGEALAGALLGLLAGAGLFALARRFAGRVTVWDVNAFPADLTPVPALAAAVAVLVPLCAVVVTLVAMRGVAVEPLGVTRQAAPRARRVWWRLLPAAAGPVLLLSAGPVTFAETSLDAAPVAAGALLTLTGVAALLPWLTEALVRRLRGGPLPWQLAVRRLQLSSGTAARAVSGIVVAAAGAIALQMLFGAVQSDFMRPTNMDEARARLALRVDATAPDAPRELIREVSAARGVTGVAAALSTSVQRPGPPRAGEGFVPSTALTVAGCPTLRELGDLPSCADGDVFIARAHGGDGPDDAYLAETARPGALVNLRDETAPPLLWRIPAGARTVEGRRDPMGWTSFGVYATPSAIDAKTLDDPVLTAWVRLDAAVPDAAEHAREAAARVSPLMRVDTVQDMERDARFTSVRRGVFAAATLTMVLVAVSLLVSTVEQLRDRGRLLSALVAFGTRRSTLAWSVLWQTAVPVVLGMALAVAGGLGLGVLLLRLTGKGVEDWWVFWPVAGVGAALVLAVTGLSLPVLWRLMRPDGLRTE
ncbi:FtsX-like permease family protein [Streptomyces sp. WAC05374]|uniref:FtsX-like permease family protein n=1 Tax=Streptomyces sp. WAC05374 TaxID=2487420 RepID=UPI000F8971CC|nr:FtsX-like permease family protein [Streptomyces sp. WAC05374]RST18568.1 FtsX-like permease family protein [Streptomyces sp. WAC05374]TDF43252.1 FtsX-like permease family protein [Streptomyces sp. WAC05374]TDF51038.1 FtsX-like permease family protein [Streptomyces sp. WAC05374]TDF52219.1 FtsX-like permease family protein [Streptomyces sp. WAC05374]